LIYSEGFPEVAAAFPPALRSATPRTVFWFQPTGSGLLFFLDFWYYSWASSSLRGSEDYRLRRGKLV